MRVDKNVYSLLLALVCVSVKHWFLFYLFIYYIYLFIKGLCNGIYM